MIIVDTAIWSKAFRRKSASGGDRRAMQELHGILENEKEILIGPVRQELLSGISDKNVFNDLMEKLYGFNNYEVQLADHDLAAEYFNVCMRKGIQGSQTDYLICAVACRYNFEIFTEDRDFYNYKKYLPITLYAIKNA
jgi:predicted nucleic acid-binding protein